MNTIKHTIRQETEKDLGEVYILIQTAFETAKVKDGDEQDFAVNLRKGPGFIPELSLVAEHAGKLTGHIMFTKTRIVQPDGKQYEGLLVAPLSVLLEYRNRGIGSALMQEGFSIARKAGYKAAFLCGDPEYYKRFGFRPAAEFGIAIRGDIPPQFVLACELEPDALKNISGQADFC